MREGEAGREFGLRFGLLSQCQARLRMPLNIVDMNLWRLEREGAWLKPMCDGRRVDLAKVDHVSLVLERFGTGPVRWCMTPLRLVTEEVEPLATPLLPKGPLLDELGQSTLHDWPAKTRSADELVGRLRKQHAEADDQKAPEQFSKWGGWREKRFDATGYFHTQHDGQRWWLVDPGRLRVLVGGAGLRECGCVGGGSGSG